MSLYGKFIKEREGIEIIEDDNGFITYSITPQAVCIYNIFVTDVMRRQGKCFSLGMQVLEIAKSKGFKHLYCTIAPSTIGSTYSLNLLLKNGFTLDSCVPGLIYLKKELE